jgi:hypothetical protein
MKNFIKEFWPPIVFMLIILAMWGVLIYEIRSDKTPPSEDITNIINAKRVKNSSLVIRVDKCEYLILIAPNGQWVMTHKGNCDNSIHKGRP